MNQRITELAEQAAKYADYYAMLSDNAEQEIFTKKFAELIVRECIDCLKPLSRNHSMVGAAQDTIREHFNLE